MRIVQAAGWYFPDSLGGTETYVASLAAVLRRRNHDVIVAAPEPDGDEPRHYAHDGIPVFRYPTRRQVTRAQARGGQIVPGAEHFHRALRGWRPDVVHFHTFVTGLGLREVEAARASGARAVVVTSHAGSLGFLCERGTLMRGGTTLCNGAVSTRVCAACALTARGVSPAAAAAVSALPLRVSRLALALSGRAGTAAGMRALVAANRHAQETMFGLIDSFVVLSDWAAEALRLSGAPAHKVHVNRLGIVNVAPAQRPPRTRRPVVFGFVGRTERIKGLEDAVAAVVSLPREVPVSFRAVVICASEADCATLRQCRAMAEHDTRITFEDAVPHAEVPALLASLDVLLCPSRVVEGGPTIALEARAAGTPVIGSRLPALTEIVRDGIDGALHDPGDVRALARCIRDAATHPEGSVDVWRTRLTAPRTVDDVAADYLKLYGGS